MSVRAYKVNKIDYKETPSFNLWHDQQIIEFIDEQEAGAFSGDLNESGGLAFVKVTTIKLIIGQAKRFELSPADVEILEDDIKDLGDDDYVQYYCF